MSTVGITIAHANPITQFETNALEVSVDDSAGIYVDSSPVIGFVNFIALRGADGDDGADADFDDPSTVLDMIAALSGQITSTQLHSDLLSSIEKIDVGPSSLESQIALLEYADSQLNTSIANDALRISANESAITAIESDITTLGSDLSTLDGQMQASSAAVSSLTTRVTVAESDIATQAQSIEGLSTQVSTLDSSFDAQASIIEQHTVAITELGGGGSVVAEALTTITAGLGGETALIALKDQVIAGTTVPLFAQHSLKLDVNGKISGYGLTSTKTESTFEILADRFAITDGANNGIVPFVVDGTDVYIQNGFVRTASIEDAAIVDAKIGGFNGTPGRLTISTPQFSLDSTGNAIFGGALNAASGTFGGSLLAGVLQSSSFDSYQYIYSTAGTFSLTVPALKSGWQTMRMRITLQGAGGGGGGGMGALIGGRVAYQGGGGGGAGAKIVYQDISVTAGQTLSISVGSAGTAGTPNTSGGAAGNGGNGGLTQVIHAGTTTYPVTAGTGGGGGYCYWNGSDYVFVGGAAGVTGGVAGVAIAMVGGGGGNGGTSPMGAGGLGSSYPQPIGAGGNGGTGAGGGGGAGTVGYNGTYYGIAYAGGVGGAAIVMIDFYDPNMLVLNTRYGALITWLDSVGHGAVPAAAR